MRLSLVLAAAAWGGLFVASQVSALPGANFCELNPESPICGGELPPIDPGDPPPPPGPCAIDPSLCPPIEDLPVLEPAEPEEALPTVDFEGAFRFKGPGFLRSGETSVTLAHDEDTFSLKLGCVDATGTVVQKGRAGKKHELFLDDASLEALADEFAFSARFFAGRGGEPLGQTAKLVLKENEDGSFSLKIKLQVVVEDLGEVVYKANLSNVEGGGPSSLRVLCR
jgi:hypothetical protein